MDGNKDELRPCHELRRWLTSSLADPPTLGASTT